MIAEEFSFTNAAGDKLAASNVLNIDGDPPVALLLHGMHDSGRQVFAGLAEQLAARGIGNMRFDHAGWGDSAGDRTRQTLQSCAYSARAALRQFDQGRASVIMGHSMGAHVAISLLENTTPDALVLFAPMAYPAAVTALPFNERFAERAHQPDAWRTSLAFETLRGYQGRVLIIVGTEDELLPPAMIDELEASCTGAGKLEILLVEGAPHGLQGWLQQPENSAVRQQVLETIVAFALPA